MKKKVLLIASVFAATSMFAQDLTSKKGETILPEADDWAIGFDAAPFLDYAGQFLGSSNNAPTADWTNSNMAIVGKMFVDANTAYRAKIRLGFGSQSTDGLYGGMTGDSLTDNMKSSYNAIVLGGGLEKRRGNTRIQGVYGGEALISLGGGKNTYTYAESLSATNTMHTNTFGQGAGLMESKMGSTFGLTLRGFIGVEVFVFPKVSIAAEYGWGLGFSSTGEGESTTEFWNGTAAESTTSKTGKSSAFGIDTDNTGGALNIIFHF